MFSFDLCNAVFEQKISGGSGEVLSVMLPDMVLVARVATETATTPNRASLHDRITDSSSNIFNNCYTAI